ncbi:MAG TPA: YHS domain-containing protein [Candidatus Dormibacteraeota bacterium]|nr:YHS domain-containing protein [Candidatus Dormibacteraeota bacterium]
MKSMFAVILATLFVAGCSSHYHYSSNRAPQAKSTPRTGLEVDPVCGMEVDPKKSPREEYSGQVWYFCSEGCEEEFKRSPAAYVRPLPPATENKVK